MSTSSHRIVAEGILGHPDHVNAHPSEIAEPGFPELLKFQIPLSDPIAGKWLQFRYEGAHLGPIKIKEEDGERSYPFCRIVYAVVTVDTSTGKVPVLEIGLALSQSSISLAQNKDRWATIFGQPFITARKDE